MTDSSLAKPSVQVPVRVTTEHATRPLDPPVALPTVAAHPAAVERKSARPTGQKRFTPTKLPLAEHQRRRVMWMVVSAAMLVIVSGWVLTFRSQLDSSGDNSFFNDVKNVFKNFSFNTRQSPSESAPEIRDLSEEIFPQFQL